MYILIESLQMVTKEDYTGSRCVAYIYTVKKVIVFPVPSRDVTNHTLPGRELLNYSRPGRIWLVTSRLGTGKSISFFYSVVSIRPLIVPM
jgi:hypothetical protein